MVFIISGHCTDSPTMFVVVYFVLSELCQLLDMSQSSGRKGMWPVTWGGLVHEE